MKVVTNRIGFSYVVTGIWLCEAEVRRLLKGEDVGLQISDPSKNPYQQAITVHMNEIGKDNSIEVEGMD